MTLRTIANDRLVDGAKLDLITVTQPIDLDAISSMTMPFVTVGTNYQIDQQYDKIVKAASSGKTITLPLGNTGSSFTVINASSGSITVATTSSQTINGSLTQVLSSGSSLTVVSDGSNYFIM